MSKTEYKRLGDYIREVNVRNLDLKVTNLLGVNLSKQFFPSIANIIGTDLSKYKIIEKGQFGCKFMSVGRDGILPISLMQDDKPAIISSAYYVFEVKDQEVLLPEYLMMWLRRPEFDRQLWFYSGGDVRGGVNYDDFCEMPIIIPSITRQREIVSEYETLSNRIRLNNQMIQNLEATAQALYRKTFVDNIDKENLPEGWRMGTLGEICIVNPKLTLKVGMSALFYDMDSLPLQGFFMGKARIRDFNSGMKFQNGDVLFARITPCMENGKAAIVADIKEDEVAFGSTEFIVLRGSQYELTSILATLIRNEEFRAFAKTQMKGTDGRQRVDATALLGYEMIIPEGNVLRKIENDLSRLYNQMHIVTKENSKLTELQSLLLAKMGQ